MIVEPKFSPGGFATRVVYTGNDVDKDSGAIKRSITMGNSYDKYASFKAYVVNEKDLQHLILRATSKGMIELSRLWD